MSEFETKRLCAGDADHFAQMNALFGAAFEDEETYTARPPDARYRDNLLSNEAFVALVALQGDTVVGALAGYELPKFEQQRSEFYLYDLAVDEGARRRGIATALIGEFGRIAARRGGWTVFVQADYGDAPAIALYEKLGRREDVMHFDIAPG